MAKKLQDDRVPVFRYYHAGLSSDEVATLWNIECQRLIARGWADAVGTKIERAKYANHWELTARMRPPIREKVEGVEQ